MASAGTILFIINIAVLAILVQRYVFTEDSKKTEDLLLSKFEESYDYIVVGSGSAGSVVAARLSEDHDVTVLVLEAGYDDRDEAHLTIPSETARSQHTKLDWEYYSEPQTHACWALKDRRVYMPRGRVLGGSSQLNFMAYARGNRFDFDQWAARGCDGWSYEDVLPYFEKSENMLDEELAKSEYHGHDGPIKISRVPTSTLPSIFLQAAKQAGYNETDYNGENQEGFAIHQSFVGDGVRSSTSQGFLWPAARERSNIHIATHAHVTKVIIENKKAIGVEVVKDGRQHRVLAKREVILSAGVFGSAQILMLSGIGPKQHLNDMKIPVIADLPVGDNLQDHAATLLRVLIDQPLSTSVERITSTWSQLKYDFFKSGYKTSPGGLEFTGYVRTRDDLQYGNPDVNYEMLVSIPAGMFIQSIMNLDPEISRALKWEADEGFLLAVGVLRPESSGTVRLRSSNPFDYPRIQPNYLSAVEDMMAIHRGVKLFKKLLETKAFKEIGARLHSAPIPTCSQYKDDDYWKCYVRSLTFGTFHQCCTCKMGALGDPTTVVDSQLRVMGIQGLRVADASTMPHIVSANTNAASIMIGEKAADLIKGEK